ncbi:MAG TPA: hypothetical protein VMI56_08845 [Reyranella sp.]|nr:hypothetical protein [Reyranella sp.]
MPAGKVSFAELMTQSFGFTFNHFRLFFHVVTVPWVLSLLIRVGGAVLMDETPLSGLIEKALDVLPTIMFMVAWMRIVLLGPNAPGTVPTLGWSARETAFLGHFLRIGGITFLLVAAFVLVVGDFHPSPFGGLPADPETARREAMAAPLGTGFAVSALLALRVSFGLAGTAVDVSFSPRLSWAYSRGSTWTIIGVLFLIFLGSGIATLLAMTFAQGLVLGLFGAATAADIVSWTVGIFLSYLGAALAATAQASIFRRLTGWRDGTPLPPP